METTILYRGYIGVMVSRSSLSRKPQWGPSGYSHPQIHEYGVYCRGYKGFMEKKMETTIL